MDPIEFYNQIKEACKQRNEDKMFKGSWCIIVVNFGDEGFAYKTPFSDWGDMDHMHYTARPVTSEYDKDIDKSNPTVYDIVFSNETLKEYHLEQLKEDPFIDDVESLIYYLEYIKQFEESDNPENISYIEETIDTLQGLREKLNHYIITDYCNDKYMIVGIIDGIVYDLGRKDAPQLLSIKGDQLEYLDEVREDYIDSLYDEYNPYEDEKYVKSILTIQN